MAQLVGDMSQTVMGNFTLLPQLISANQTGIAVPTTGVDGDIYTMRAVVGCAAVLTSIVYLAECSADGQTWVAAQGVGGTTPNVTLTAANTFGAVAFYPGNGTVSQYVRGNAILTGTSGNIACVIEAQNRIGTAGGFQNTPPSGAT